MKIVSIDAIASRTEQNKIIIKRETELKRKRNEHAHGKKRIEFPIFSAHRYDIAPTPITPRPDVLGKFNDAASYRRAVPSPTSAAGAKQRGTHQIEKERRKKTKRNLLAMTTATE